MSELDPERMNKSIQALTLIVNDMYRVQAFCLHARKGFDTGHLD